MERIFKLAWILMVVFLVAITLGSVADQDAYAGGGVNYKVTVKNDTEYNATATIWVDKVAYDSTHSSAAIQSGGSHTFETGAWCPAKLVGSISVSGITAEFERRFGVEGLWGDCSSSSWRIVKDASGRFDSASLGTDLVKLQAYSKMAVTLTGYSFFLLAGCGQVARGEGAEDS